MELLGSSTVISVIVSIAIAGGVFVYLRGRIAELERLHVEQARILKSFIAHQQHIMIQGGGGVAMVQPDVPMQRQIVSTPPQTELVPRDKVVVSDEGSESGSSYTDSDSESDGDQSTTSVDDGDIVELVHSDRIENQPMDVVHDITMVPVGVIDTHIAADDVHSIKVIDMSSVVDDATLSTLIQTHDTRSKVSPVSSSSESSDEEDSDDDDDDDKSSTPEVSATHESNELTVVNLKRLPIGDLRQLAVDKGIVPSISQARAYKKTGLIDLIAST